MRVTKMDNILFEKRRLALKTVFTTYKTKQNWCPKVYLKLLHMMNGADRTFTHHFCSKMKINMRVTKGDF